MIFYPSDNELIKQAIGTRSLRQVEEESGISYELDKDILVKHGTEIVEVPRTFEGLKEYLEKHVIEGIVFWKDGEPRCKIKRSDFGFKWPAGGVKE